MHMTHTFKLKAKISSKKKILSNIHMYIYGLPHFFNNNIDNLMNNYDS